MAFSLFGLTTKDLVVGGVTALGSMVPGFGVVVGPLAGAATSAIWSRAEGKSWTDAIQGGIVDGALGALPVGKLFGSALERLAAGSAGRLGKLGLESTAQKLFDLGPILEKMPAGVSFAPRVIDSWGRMATRAVGRGVGAAVANRIYDSMTPAPGVPELPTKPIS